MKKIIIAALVIFFFTPLLAQKGFHFGFRGTSGSSLIMNPQDSENPSYKYLFRGAGKVLGTFTYNFTDKLGVGTGLGANFIRSQPEYVQDTPDPFDPSFIITQKANYFLLPIYFHVNSNPDKLFMGYFYIGPEFNFLTKAEMEYFEADAFGVTFSQGVSGNVFNSGEQQVFEDAHSNVVIGGAMGFGIQFNIKDIVQIYGGLAFSGTFTDMYTDDAVKPVLNPNPADADDKYMRWSGTLSPTGEVIVDGVVVDHTLDGVWSLDKSDGSRGTTFSGLAGADLGIRYTLRK